MSKQFDDSEIEDIYNTKVKKPNSYFESLPADLDCPSPEIEWLWKYGDYPRCRIILDFQKWIQKYNLSTPKYLGYTYKTDPELLFLMPEKSKYLPYPQIDLHILDSYFVEIFDMILINQTLEHLYNPFQVVQHFYKALKPGGVLFTSVPTIAIPHTTPFHFSGFTPMGLAMLFSTAGFEILEVGQWGCQAYIQEHWKRQEWLSASDLKQLYSDGNIPNEENCCIQCWILVKKPV